ncbi:peroxidase domain-containing protein [Hirsutella rhossiliensis]|uniref:Peroxidase n=1 Tax=Hirsutella rhossiliensis TaxID=111463 RepID=A0A9P8MRG0_9HYPO|nr:peroxidase domain-containing protein [Hirsutella rhossiliensis]KAH0958841.1 peroxidase domain-containing protein [Hirsutella rhossiliensis]
MKATALLLLAGNLAHGFSGMRDLKARAASLESRGTNEMIGDLVNLPDNRLTKTGADIKALLTGGQNPEELTDRYDKVPDKDSPKCKADTCCIWKHIADDMRSKMVGSARRCNDLARGCIRLGFHDAATWSKNTGPGGGSDGSIVLARECYDREINKGLEPTCDQMTAWHNQYKKYNVGMADLIQFAANVATVACPLGPRVRTFVGRKDDSKPAPDGLMPLPSDSADKLISMFGSKTIAPDELVALVGAHTTAQQRFVDPSRAGDPLDSTPGVWDVRFYGQVTSSSTPRRVFKFQSDINLSQDPRTNGPWKAFSGPTGQRPWNGAYSRAYIRLSLLGVNNINDLKECSKALPSALDFFQSPDQSQLDAFANGKFNDAKGQLMQGDNITAPP